MMAAAYEVRLYIDGVLIGNVRELAQNLQWVRRRTKVGADEIDFTLNDVLFDRWCKARGTDIATMLKPIALECRIFRNGIPILGGYLATMPGYSPNGTCANLAMRFDGFLNLLDGVYIRPIGMVAGEMGILAERFITEADDRARDAGKAYGFTSGIISTMPTVQHTFDNYKSTKEWLCDRCDNVEGAGKFDVYFHEDKTYDIVADGEFGDIITDWIATYPTRLNGPSATSITADEVAGFASAVIGIGSGEVSSEESENTAIASFASNERAVEEYGYFETIMQESDISVQSTLDQKTATTLSNTKSVKWQPQITLSGTWVSPIPSGHNKIWIGDTISVKNTEDLTGMTNGQFRVNELSVTVSASGSEEIKPILERV